MRSILLVGLLGLVGAGCASLERPAARSNAPLELAEACPAPSSAAYSLTSDEMRRIGAPSLVDAIVGRVPGVYQAVIRGQRAIQVRGATNFTPQEPLIVLDGTPMVHRGVRALNSISVGDVAYVEVFTGGSGVSRYGYDGSYGVVQVVTRRGGCDGAPGQSFASVR